MLAYTIVVFVYGFCIYGRAGQYSKNIPGGILYIYVFALKWPYGLK